MDARERTLTLRRENLSVWAHYRLGMTIDVEPTQKISRRVRPISMAKSSASPSTSIIAQLVVLPHCSLNELISSISAYTSDCLKKNHGLL